MKVSTFPPRTWSSSSGAMMNGISRPAILTVLSGTTRLTGGGLKSCTDANQEDKRFIVLQDVQDLIADERELKMVELRPDEYEEK